MEIRGVWITTTDSKVFDKPENIAEAMKFLAETGFNVVFPVVWNQGFTNYPSEVMKATFGKDREINPRFIDKNTGKPRDPLGEIIAEAKKWNIAVIPWFEYGFMSSYQIKRGSIIEKKPEWTAKDSTGIDLIVNNFYWLNAFDSKVQDFLLSLFLEVVTKYKYDIAGIQGDDHFPAFPVEGGYNLETIELYEQEFKEKPPKPPGKQDPQDSECPEKWKQWVRWRADILSVFLSRVYREIININPELIISIAPNVYPWGYINYLQDSQTWIDLGLVDLIHPQIYRDTIESYQSEIDRIKKDQFTQKQLPQLIPGIKIKTGKYRITPEHLVNALNYNRKVVGIQGEVCWFYEGLREDNDALAKVLKSGIYSQPPGIFDAKEIKKYSFTHRRSNNDDYYYINITSQQIRLKVKFDWVEPLSEGISAVKVGYKYGYIQQTGKFITRLKYDTAAPFTAEMALVSMKSKYGYIDKTGKEIIPVKFDDAMSFSEAVAAVKIGNKWGYIDEVGTMIISSQFDEAKSFFSDIAAVKIGDKWGYIDKTGSIVILAEFDDARSFYAGLAVVQVGNKWGYIDRTGQFIINPQFDEADIFSEELAAVKMGEKWGYINQYGDLIIPLTFDFAKPFAEGMALVNVGGELKPDQEQGKAFVVGGKWGYIRKP
ncbi:WG repeat-containing protein [Dolichospermum circinale CS-537/01]|uniref:WG repeat-containing protein n=1 Tax=Dolichospermum circinale CS-537/01 TaxID=3021739 RepID=A0ABT5A6V6_9CYAN|nr:WG repeat-containing protein [Dolichospermum circinale]MDB9487687.1 WG repeat-containing protein [Dolichospermum circinale CS-537/01]